jgi:hypothetical protein
MTSAADILICSRRLTAISLLALTYWRCRKHRAFTDGRLRRGADRLGLFSDLPSGDELL